ncbi:hypothetical protein Q7P37_001792 [Cladosporium fusiforme]
MAAARQTFQQLVEAARNSPCNAPKQGVLPDNGASIAPAPAGNSASQPGSDLPAYVRPGEYLYNDSTIPKDMTPGLPSAFLMHRREAKAINHRPDGLIAAGTKRGAGDEIADSGAPAEKRQRLEELPAAPAAEIQPVSAAKPLGRKREDPYNLMGSFFHTHLRKVPNRQLGETRKEGEPERPVWDPSKFREPTAAPVSKGHKSKQRELSEAPSESVMSTSGVETAAAVVESGSEHRAAAPKSRKRKQKELPGACAKAKEPASGVESAPTTMEHSPEPEEPAAAAAAKVDAESTMPAGNLPTPTSPSLRSLFGEDEEDSTMTSGDLAPASPSLRSLFGEDEDNDSTMPAGDLPTPASPSLRSLFGEDEDDEDDASGAAMAAELKAASDAAQLEDEHMELTAEQEALATQMAQIEVLCDSEDESEEESEEEEEDGEDEEAEVVAEEPRPAYYSSDEETSEDESNLSDYNKSSDHPAVADYDVGAHCSAAKLSIDNQHPPSPDSTNTFHALGHITVADYHGVAHRSTAQLSIDYQHSPSSRSTTTFLLLTTSLNRQNTRLFHQHINTPRHHLQIVNMRVLDLRGINSAVIDGSHS